MSLLMPIFFLAWATVSTTGQPRRLQLSLSDTLTVRVISDSGATLEGATVAVIDHSAGEPRRLFVAYTDSVGTAKLSLPDLDSLTLEVRLIGFDQQQVALRGKAKRSRLTVKLKVARLALREPCTTDQKPAIRLLVDSSGVILSVTALVRVSDGQYEDRRLVILPPAAGNIDLAAERGGIYEIEVLAPGYQPWRRHEVHVVTDYCGAHTETFRVRLVPEASK